jgi:hypothetical protein
MSRRRIVLGLAPVLAVVTATAALGAWSANAPAGNGKSEALTVPQGTGGSAADGTGSSVITWTAVTAAQFSPGATGYKVVRYANSSGTTGATTICANAATATCTDSSGTAGTFWYGVSALYAPVGVSWTGAESIRNDATVTAAATLVITGGTRSGGSGNASFKGSGGVGGNPVTVRWCAGATFTCGSPGSIATSNSPVGSWTTQITGGNPFTAGSTYTAVATQGANTSLSFTFTLPTANSGTF